MIASGITLHDRYRGALLGLAVGNALGLPAESLSRDAIGRIFPEGIRDIDPAETRLPGDDDLAQAVLIAEAILEHDTLGNDDLARRLLDWFESNGRGMGHQTRAVLNALKHGMLPSEAARAVWEATGGTAGNEAVMRGAPIAMRWRLDPARLRVETENSARITHHDPRCGWSALAVNLAVAGALNGRPSSIETIAAMLEEAEVGPITVQAARWTAGHTLEDLRLDTSARGFALKSMQVALWCLESGADVERSLIAVVEAGGDTGANGAVAGAILGALHGASSIPPRWVGRIAQGERLAAIADQLLARAEVAA